MNIYTLSKESAYCVDGCYHGCTIMENSEFVATSAPCACSVELCGIGCVDHMMSVCSSVAYSCCRVHSGKSVAMMRLAVLGRSIEVGGCPFLVVVVVPILTALVPMECRLRLPPLTANHCRSVRNAFQRPGGSSRLSLSSSSMLE